MPNWTKEQLDAINTDGTNILVSAGAGSGKTAVLSERVLRKVKDGVNINEILILTFTKAAANEMAERIRKKLIENKLDKQVELIDNAYITTFDSFSLAVVNKYSDILNLKKNIRIIDNNSINLFKKEILDEIFNKYYENDNSLFNNLISLFCLRDDKELKEYILKLNSDLDLKYDKKEYLDNYLNNFYSDIYINKTFKEYEDILINYIEEIKLELNRLSLILDGDIIEQFYLELDKLFDSKEYDDIKNNLDITLPRLPKGSGDLAKEIKDNISSSIKALKELCIYDKQRLIEDYIETKDYIKVLIDIIMELDTKIYDYKIKHNVFEFIDVAKIAINLVKNNNDIRSELTNSFKEIMIDEYQDTSDIQEEFISLISNNNVYMVGDIKQSIYRFRNANPNIFKDKYNSFSKGINGIKIDLNKNFRSRKEVLDNINEIFNSIMDDSYGGANYLEEHQLVFGNNSYINEGNTNQNYNFSIFNYHVDKESDYKKYSKDEIEAFIIANDIKEKINSKYKIFDKDLNKLHDIKYNDFTILVDKSSKFTLYKKIFEYLKIPLTIYKDINISDNDEVYLIKNILKLIECVNNNDFSNTFKYSYVSVARSYLFRYSDQDIYDTVINSNYSNTEIFKIINSLVSEVSYLDLKSLINKIINNFNFYQHMLSVNNIEERITTLEYFINLANNLSSLDYDYHMFIKYLDDITLNKLRIDIPISVVSEDSVKIMTIHKSKGLEYPICYYSGISNQFNISDLNEKILFDNTYGIIVPSYINGYTDTYIKRLVRNKYLNDEISEKIRLFYVALTRAKEKMIIVSNLGEENDINELTSFTKNKYRSFLDILNSIKHKLDNYIIDYSLDSINLTRNYLNKNITNLDIDLIDKDLKVDEYNTKDLIEVEDKHFSKTITKLITKEEKDNLMFGTKIHEIFELTDFKSDNNQNKYIINFLNQPLLKNIKDANILKEYEFYTTNNDQELHGIIDLLLEYKDHIDIIDYKLKNIDDSEYLNQLNGYKSYIEKKTKKEVNIYLYSIIDDNIKKL